MKTVKTDEIKKCDLCSAKGKEYYDALTVYGTWANMCPVCYKDQGSSSVGTHFVLRDRSNQPEASDKVLMGKEASDMETIVMDGDREIECPNCGELRSVEPDASYKFTCEGCGSEVQVPCLMF